MWGEWLDKKQRVRYTFYKKGAAGQTVVPPGLLKEATARLGKLGRLLLFIACGPGHAR